MQTENTSNVMLYDDPRRAYSIHLTRLTQAMHDVACIALAYQAPLSRELELSSSYNRLLSASAETKRTVLSDPRVAMWVENAQTLLGEPDGLSLPEATWVELLAFYAKCALAAAHIEGTGFTASVALDSQPRIALPGCKILVPTHARIGTTVVQVTVEPSGSCLVNGKTARSERLPRAGLFELAIVEQDLRPPIEASEYSLNGAEVREKEWLQSLAEADRILSSDPASRELVQHFGTVIVPIPGGETDTHCSVSFSGRPGVLYMSLGPGRVLAEAIVHESDHQLLYTLKRLFEFWDDSSAEELAVYRSPWRSDPRPLDGLLRGASAFVRVGAFWTEIISVASLEQEADRIGLRAVLSLQQSCDAIETVRRHGDFTSEGCEFIDHLEHRARKSLERLVHQGSYGDWSRSAVELRRTHDAAWRVRHGGRNQVGQDGG
jgi:HEXXH motif-containing protein